MAIKYVCDGCGASVEQPQTRGLVQVAHYCDTCVPLVDAYLRERDDLHTSMADTLSKALAALAAETKLKLARLPDELY